MRFFSCFRVAKAAVAVLAMHSFAFAQNQTNASEEVIEEITVEGTRLGQTIAEAGSSISVIEAEQLQTMGFRFAADALAAAPGVTVNQNGSFGGQASVRIRGAASEQTLVLVDGVPANDPSTPGGGFNFARMDSGMIERIEILKGPQSSLWGSDAIGGVVSITTREPEAGGAVYADFGSFATRHGGASFGHAGASGDFRLAGSAVSSDGISKADAANGNDEDDAYDSRSLSARGGLELAGGARLRANFLSTSAEADFDSFSFGAQGSVADGDETSETEESTANLSLTLPALDDRLEHLLLVGHSEIDRENFSGGTSTFSAEGRRSIFRYQGTLAIDERNTLAFGAENERSETSSDDNSINSVFAVHEFKPAANLTLTGGLRSDRHDRYGSEFTARAAGAFDYNDNLTLRASWGEGFKAPTLFQTTFFCCGAPGPNSGLLPESSTGFDAGIDWRSTDGLAGAGLTLFRQSTENLINFSFGIGGYENIAEVESSGVELSYRQALTDRFSLSADYAWVDAEDGAGNPLPRLPSHSGDLMLSFDSGGAVSGAILLRYNGSESNTNGTTLESWARIDVTGRYRISEDLEIYARVENLTDEQYQQILGYGTPGLSGSVGVRLAY